jgi:hypothetical protein
MHIIWQFPSSTKLKSQKLVVVPSLGETIQPNLWVHWKKLISVPTNVQNMNQLSKKNFRIINEKYAIFFEYKYFMGTCKDMVVTDKRILVQCQKLLSHGTYLRTDVSGSKNYSTRSSSSDPSSTSQLSLSSRGALTFHCGYHENDVCER